MLKKKKKNAAWVVKLQGSGERGSKIPKTKNVRPGDRD